ncbi:MULTISPECIES: hypothetical protein [unclassified Paenibacillus]|uniref:hypothetical protein n=1 Tax=unclassified Paenibacillus TaxID=185978 RepID=UPI0004F5F799|nr:hypothetical protein [Paenibacillus sp. FSL P4-0081]AIQ27162.1 hypothetical protein P40081_02350 [Paenibacillus sp. FSL P4-0081]
MYPRSAKRRKRKYTKLGLRILQSGVAVSVLIMYTSNQIGSTYGEYNTSQEQNTSIGLCSVFPGQIEQLLSEFSGHVRTITQLKSSLGSHITSGNYNTPPVSEELSAEELDQISSEISEQIRLASDTVSALDTQLSLNAGIWQQILQEIGSAAAILHQLGGYMVNLEPNCLEIRDARFFEQLQEGLHQSGVLSESLTDTLTGIVHYLNTIHDFGGSLPTGNPDRVLLRQESFGFPAEEPIFSLMARAYNADPNVSPALQSSYDQLSAELTASRDNLSSTISTLQEQQVHIAEAKAALEEKAKAEEAERLALEKAKAEEAERDALEKQKQENDQTKNNPPAASIPGEDKTIDEPAIEAPEGEKPAPAPSPDAEVTAPPATPAPEANLPEATPAADSPGELPDSGTDTAQPTATVTPTATPAPQSDTSKGGE